MRAEDQRPLLWAPVVCPNFMTDIHRITHMAFPTFVVYKCEITLFVVYQFAGTLSVSHLVSWFCFRLPSVVFVNITRPFSILVKLLYCSQAQLLISLLVFSKISFYKLGCFAMRGLQMKTQLLHRTNTNVKCSCIT